MRNITQGRDGWTSRHLVVVIGGLLGLSGFLTVHGTPWPRAGGPVPAQAAERHKRHSPKAEPVEVALFMIRNAYHLATLYHAAEAAHWELAAYQAEELEENITQTAHRRPAYGGYRGP